MNKSKSEREEVRLKEPRLTETGSAEDPPCVDTDAGPSYHKNVATKCVENEFNSPSESKLSRRVSLPNGAVITQKLRLSQRIVFQVPRSWKTHDYGMASGVVS